MLVNNLLLQPTPLKRQLSVAIAEQRIKAFERVGPLQRKIVLILIGVYAVGCQFGRRRLTPQRFTPLPNQILNPVKLLPERARTPVKTSQCVQYRSPNALHRVAAKTVVGFAVAAQSLEQADQRNLLHILALHHAAALWCELPDDFAYQRQISLQIVALLGRRQRRQGLKCLPLPCG